ncbi:hypothetical protein [Scatolibacter rhodanostii]|uniref:hypothetical protein n=1 Tax=Scatolibacter rhodanostii TaxID=2014781 RepID=UPI000C0758C6|nr:hypothetical protein [Scatolibacter rhodanostii]
MNFGQNILNIVAENAQALVIVGLLIGGVLLAIKRKFAMLVGFAGVSLVAVGIVFNYNAVKDLLLKLFNQIIGMG